MGAPSKRLGEAAAAAADYRAHNNTDKMASQLMPLELIDRCIGSKMRVIMKGDKGKLFLGGRSEELRTNKHARVQRYSPRVRRLRQ